MVTIKRYAGYVVCGSRECRISRFVASNVSLGKTSYQNKCYKTQKFLQGVDGENSENTIMGLRGTNPNLPGDMRPISPKFRKRFDTDPFFKHCARNNSECEGRITIEHAFQYANKQIDEWFNFVPLCWYHHLGNGLDKHTNQLIAVSRATDEELARYPKRDWAQLKSFLLTK